jgi:hypothetical protein
MVGMIDSDANVFVFLRRIGLTLTYHGRVVDGGNRINFLNTTFDWFRLRTAATTPSPSFDMADYRFVARVLPLKGPNFEQVFGRALDLNAVVDENHWFRTYMRHQLEYLDADRILPIKSNLGPSPLRNVDFLNGHRPLGLSQARRGSRRIFFTISHLFAHGNWIHNSIQHQPSLTSCVCSM